MSDGGIYVGTDDNTTYKDLEREKWEQRRDGCPCKSGLFCSANECHFCRMECCPHHYWAGQC